MKEAEEDMLIGLYLTREGKNGFTEDYMNRFIIIMKLIKKVRKEMRKK